MGTFRNGRCPFFVMMFQLIDVSRKKYSFRPPSSLLCADSWSMLRFMQKIIVICLFAAIGIVDAGVYRWVDQNGQIHFSDQPRAGAEQIKLKETSIYTPPSASETGAANPEAQESEPVPPENASAAANYESISIASPENNQVIRSIDGMVNVSVELRPGLLAGHKIRIYLDGVRAAQDLESTQITLQNTDRGTHALQVSVIDENNNELKRSSAMSFHMLRLAEPLTSPFSSNASDG